MRSWLSFIGLLLAASASANVPKSRFVLQFAAANSHLSTPISFTYDARGNLTSDGRRTLYYDAENQLTMVQVGSECLSKFRYDGLMRRRILEEYTQQNNQWVKTNEVRYVYDGNLLIQERDANNKPLVNYTRGNDLLGAMQGAGGIGGLLARSQTSTVKPRHAYYHADGNGNITALVNTNGLRVAQYHYDPYGNLLAASGPLADANLYRFSSKEWHQQSGLIYYLYRYYVPELDRWLNADPLGDIGSLVYQTIGIAPWSGSEDEYELTPGELQDTWIQTNRNLHGAIGNNPIGSIDPYGLDWLDTSANVCAGVGDNLTFGATDMAREALGWNDRVDKDSKAYKGGDAATTGVQLATGLPGIVKATGKQGLKQAEKSLAKQLKRLSSGEIKKLKKAGVDPHDLKPNSKYDLFKDAKGDIHVKPKGGCGPGDPTGININNPTP